MPEVLSVRRLNRALLARQALLDRVGDTASAMVERLAGVQAQEAAPPFVGLWSRIDGFRREDLLAALRDGEVVRATAMRGTIHLLSAADYARHRMTLQPVLRTALRMPEMRAVAEDADLDAVLALGHRLLTDEPRTIAALEAPLHDAFPQLDGHAAAQVARMLLPLVQVPTPGHPDGFAPGSTRFAPAEQRLTEPLAPEGPAHELVRRYLAAFGPATAADATKWSGLTGMREVLGQLDGVVVLQDEAGRTLYDLRDAPRPAEDVAAPVRFLPRFDNALLSHVHHERILDPAHRPHVFTVNGIIFGTVLVDGFAVATWTSSSGPDGARIRVVPFRRPSQRAAASIRAEGRRLLRFLAPGRGAREVEIAPAVGAA
ncbi:winged helix DNA-binding domain-containing protein [Patulibacter sp.]|uniref:winged helix DNA-binding domain-containing protein n=1 Tax=Patulibacter sp. TaxID=1912859 RepID=UPI0027212914|nr:winged helix DNA-binding domain-containing protein [Patulibacter sp.]MDO9408397.1 winged helix DNA-binding domain-containing protein [Patulibacter sp.]